MKHLLFATLGSLVVIAACTPAEQYVHEEEPEDTSVPFEYSTDDDTGDTGVEDERQPGDEPLSLCFEVVTTEYLTSGEATDTETTSYDYDGLAESWELDAGTDGSTDATWLKTYRDGLVTEHSYDDDANGFPDRIDWYDWDDEVLSEIEHDTDGDAEADARSRYRYADDGEIDRIEYDADLDGKNDGRTTYLWRDANTLYVTWDEGPDGMMDETWLYVYDGEVLQSLAWDEDGDGVRDELTEYSYDEGTGLLAEERLIVYGGDGLPEDEHLRIWSWDGDLPAFVEVDFDANGGVDELLTWFWDCPDEAQE